MGATVNIFYRTQLRRVTLDILHKYSVPLGLIHKKFEEDGMVKQVNLSSSIELNWNEWGLNRVNEWGTSLNILTLFSVHTIDAFGCKI